MEKILNDKDNNPVLELKNRINEKVVEQALIQK